MREQVVEVIRALAGPLKRRLAGLIYIVHTKPVLQPAVFIQLVAQPVAQPVVQPDVKCKHRVRRQRAPRPDESIVQGVSGAEPAMHRCLVTDCTVIKNEFTSAHYFADVFPIPPKVRFEAFAVSRAAQCLDVRSFSSARTTSSSCVGPSVCRSAGRGGQSAEYCFCSQSVGEVVLRRCGLQALTFHQRCSAAFDALQ